MGRQSTRSGDPYIGRLLAKWDDMQDPQSPPAVLGDLYEEVDLDQIAWTPLAHACGCVTDWGWDAAHADPIAFINWCSAIIDNPCPWHVSDLAPLDDRPRSSILVSHLDGGPSFYARQATGDDIALGRHLTRELAKIRQLVVNGDTEAILAEIPPAYRNWTDINGHDPADTWIRQRLANVILNRGHSMLPGFDDPTAEIEPGELRES